MVQSKTHDSIAAKLNDNVGIEAALHAAAEDARQMHVRTGLQAVGARDGCIVTVEPTTLKDSDPVRRDSAI